MPKVPDLVKYVKKRQKLLYCFGNLESEGLNFCIEFAYPFHQTLWKSGSKKTSKINFLLIFISNSSTIFAFMITLPIHSLQFNFGQVHSIVPQCFRGVREPSYPPTLIPSNPLYRQYFILDNVLLIKGSRKILLKMR